MTPEQSKHSEPANQTLLWTGHAESEPASFQSQLPREPATERHTLAGRKHDPDAGVPADEFLRHVVYVTNDARTPAEIKEALLGYAAGVVEAMETTPDACVPHVVAHVARSWAERLGFDPLHLFNGR